MTNSKIKSKINSCTKNFAKLALGYISLVQDSLISKPTRSIWFGQIQFSEKLFSSSWKQFLKTRMRLRRSIFLDKLKACLQKTWLLAYWLPIRLMTWWSLLSTSLSWLMSQVAWTSWCRILTTLWTRSWNHFTKNFTLLKKTGSWKSHNIWKLQLKPCCRRRFWSWVTKKNSMARCRLSSWQTLDMVRKMHSILLHVMWQLQYLGSWARTRSTRTTGVNSWPTNREQALQLMHSNGSQGKVRTFGRLQAKLALSLERT